MNDFGALPTGPPPPPAAPPGGGETPRTSRHLRAVAGGAATVLVTVAAAGGLLALRAFHGSADTTLSLVPSNTALYVSVNFDPSVGQKLAVEGLLNKFPALEDQSRSATVNGWLDHAFSASGLGHNDISPWFGSRLSIAVPASAVSALIPSADGAAPPPPQVTVLIGSRDDVEAQAALDKFRSGPVGSRATWTTTVHGGVTVAASAAEAYAIADHTVIFATNSSAVDAAIDTAQGKRASLASSTRFQAVDGQLPTDRLGIIYMDVPAFVQRLGSSLSGVPGADAQLRAVRAYEGVGMAVVASPAGIALEGTENYDASRLTPALQAQVGVAPHINGAVAFVPRSAFGLIAYTGVQQTLTSALGTLAPEGSAMALTLEQAGLTGAGGLLGHLRGDAGLEVDRVPGQSAPAGALLFSTDSTIATQSLLDNLMSSICRRASVCDPSQLTTQVDRGVVISSVPLGASSTGSVEPSWAVTGGWAIIGSSAAEVRAVLDSHTSGSTITTTSGYRTVTTQVGSSNDGELYIDVPAVLGAIGTVLPPSAEASFARSTAYLDHLGAVYLSERNGPGHLTFTLFVQVR